MWLPEAHAVDGLGQEAAKKVQHAVEEVLVNALYRWFPQTLPHPCKIIRKTLTGSALHRLRQAQKPRVQDNSEPLCSNHELLQK
eukprot:1576349-Amphidinium_carterae.1